METAEAGRRSRGTAKLLKKPCFQDFGVEFAFQVGYTQRIAGAL
jgi:hypothetical protein